MNPPIRFYHELRKASPEKARMLVRKVLEQNGGNVSKTARILGISCHTVRRARDGSLSDLSRAPKHIQHKTSSDLEALIVKEAKRTGFRYVRLSKYLFKQYGIEISQNTIRAILKRNEVKPKRVRTKSKGTRHLYNYEELEAFEELQIDTKYLHDSNSLPKDVYENMRRRKLPFYEWNAIDAKTRMRFTAYSWELNSTFGLMFVLMVVMWLRLHNKRGRIRIRVDNGSEFFNGSERKKKEWNRILGLFEAEIYNIPPGAKQLMGIVENSHRVDDESFLIVHGGRSRSAREFLFKAQKWQDVWNKERESFGIGMGGKTPLEKLEEVHDGMINKNVVNFPVITLEELSKEVDSAVMWLSKFKPLSHLLLSGKYLRVMCQQGKASDSHESDMPL